MIGHDLVDLSLARKAHRWNRKGFLEKIFDPAELDIVHSGADLFTSVWWFWSQKEAVYKIINRKSGRRWFNPHAFRIADFGTETTVLFGPESYAVRTQLTQDKIESIAIELTADFKRVTIIDLKEVLKNGGLPFYKDASGKLLPASVSHHGKYASAYTLLNA